MSSILGDLVLGNDALGSVDVLNINIGIFGRQPPVISISTQSVTVITPEDDPVLGMAVLGWLHLGGIGYTVTLINDQPPVLNLTAETSAQFSQTGGFLARPGFIGVSPLGPSRGLGFLPSITAGEQPPVLELTISSTAQPPVMDLAAETSQ